MKTRDIGTTGVALSEVSLGTWGLSEPVYGAIDLDRSVTLCERAIDLGVRTFDMAPLWGDGEGERVVARAVGSRRDLVRYVTRAGVRREAGKLVRGYAPSDLEAALTGSLERLATDRIDVWLLHDPPEAVLRSSDWKDAVLAHKREGRVRAWGVSVSDVDRARLAMAQGAEVVCLPYNLLESDDVHDLGAELSLARVGLLARSPLAYGLLSDTWHETMLFPETDHRARRFGPRLTREYVRTIRELRFLVHDDVSSFAAAALRYVLASNLVTSAIVGARTVAQLEELAAAAVGPPYLSEADLSRIPQVLAAASR
jgi:aryl-alcohol dehydrogenase-like predicted oxidoreductase